ncbi:MAG: hypothetical protein AAGF12_01080 [Myxococcota bacterium]
MRVSTLLIFMFTFRLAGCAGTAPPPTVVASPPPVACADREVLATEEEFCRQVARAEDYWSLDCRLLEEPRLAFPGGEVVVFETRYFGAGAMDTSQWFVAQRANAAFCHLATMPTEALEPRSEQTPRVASPAEFRLDGESGFRLEHRHTGERDAEVLRCSHDGRWGCRLGRTAASLETHSVQRPPAPDPLAVFPVLSTADHPLLAVPGLGHDDDRGLDGGESTLRDFTFWAPGHRAAGCLTTEAESLSIAVCDHDARTLDVQAADCPDRGFRAPPRAPLLALGGHHALEPLEAVESESIDEDLELGVLESLGRFYQADQGGSQPVEFAAYAVRFYPHDVALFEAYVQGEIVLVHGFTPIVHFSIDAGGTVSLYRVDPNRIIAVQQETGGSIHQVAEILLDRHLVRRTPLAPVFAQLECAT